jgi:feruloyl esterase
MACTWFWASILLFVAVSPSWANQTCMDFDPTELVHNSTLRLREYIRKNTTIFLDGMDPSCSRFNQTIPVDACRVALTVPTSNRSSFILELFLPDSDLWNGRYLATGNGGIDGCIKYEDIAYGLQHGFAVTGSNNGHNGTGGKDFLNNPDIIIDFSWRALHNGVVAGKEMVNAYYGSPPNRSYYLGCSGGGRQGIQAASMFPSDYHGVLVGAPALNFNYMSAWRARFFTLTGAVNGTGFISAETWQGLIHDEVLRQCDRLDGLEDGILGDSNLCSAIFRPEALICNGTAHNNCLSSEQVEVVRQVFSPLYGVTGELIYPPLAPGAELQATDRLLSGSPFPYSVDWYRYAVYSDPSWDPANWTVDDIAPAETANPGNARTWPDDLSPLRENGAKLLIYHGGADQQITAFDTERWYNYLSRQMGATSEDLDDFVRFFRIPGMGHCQGGVGAWQIGQNAAGAKGLPYQAENNVLAALVNWVEEGRAPETLVGTKFVNDSMASGKKTERVHCRYPFRITYNATAVDEAGKGSCM